MIEVNDILNALDSKHGKFARQPHSKAVINIDTDEYNRYKAEREKILQLNRVSQEVQQLQKDMGDIKMLLQQLVNGK